MATVVPMISKISRKNNNIGKNPIADIFKI